MEDVGDPNAWTLTELISIGLCAGIFVACLIATTWQAFTPKDRLFKRAYWVGCCFLMWAGIAGLFYVTAFPPEHFDDAGHLIGEMPAEFGLACTLVAFACGAAVIGFAITALAHVLHKSRQEKASS